MKATKLEILTTFLNGTQAGYIPTLIDLSKEENITGKIAYNCGRSLTAFSNALKDFEKARIIILETKAVKGEDGKAKIAQVLKQSGVNEDGTPKMIPVVNVNGQPEMKYVYETPEIEAGVLTEVNNLENLPMDVDIYTIPASEIIQLKSMKDGGLLIFKLGEIIDHSK